MKRTILASLVLAPFIAIACSAGSNSDGFGPGVGGSGGGNPEDSSVIFSDTGLPGSGGSMVGVDVVASDGVWVEGGDCTGLSVAAEPYPLDMYVMMDQSGSMGAPVGFSGKTQWTAVEDAFVSFLQTSPSQGLSMGIQFFPLPIVPWDQVPSCDPDSPNCASDAACVGMDNGDFCMTKCSGSTCANGADCMDVSSGTGGSGGGTSESICNNDTCDTARYAEPEVEIAALPGNNTAIINAIKGHGPLTMTPSAPALEGAVQHAKQWATQHPNHTTVVVFATDGMPTVCSGDAVFPINEVKDIAQQGVNGTPSIKTFVIGVIAMGNTMATGNLNAVAQSGGTNKAFIIQANQDMTAQFSAALEAIRGAMMQCEMQVPNNGALLDYDKVNVVYEAVNASKNDVYYVENLGKCDAVNGGWYYDVDPANGGTPQKIILCPQSCDFIKAHGGKIDIVMGCKTLKPPA